MALQRVVRTAHYITGAELPAIQDIYIRRCERKARKIVKDSNHPSHRLCSLLLHGKRYWSMVLALAQELTLYIAYLLSHVILISLSRVFLFYLPFLTLTFKKMQHPQPQPNYFPWLWF